MSYTSDVRDFVGILSLAKAKSAQKKPRTAFVVPSDVTTLKAFIQAVESNLIDPVIIGDENLLREKSSANNINLNGIEIFDIIELFVGAFFQQVFEFTFVVRNHVAHNHIVDVQVLDKA